MNISSDKQAVSQTRKLGQEKGNLKRETEILLIAAKNNAIRTNYVKARIDKTKKKKIADLDYAMIQTKRSTNKVDVNS